MATTRTCRVCGCTEFDCRQCIHKTGAPCSWVGADLCSACVGGPVVAKCYFHLEADPERKFTMSFTAEIAPGNERENLEELSRQQLAALGLTGMIINNVKYTYNPNIPYLWLLS